MAANQKTIPLPASYVPSVHRVLGGALAPGSATASGALLAEVIPIANARYLTIRIKTGASGTGTLAFDFVRPVATEPFQLSSGATDPAQVTKYVSPASPTAVAVSASTETSMQVTCNGESFGIVSFTGTGTSTITYVDVAAL